MWTRASEQSSGRFCYFSYCVKPPLGYGIHLKATINDPSSVFIMIQQAAECQIGGKWSYPMDEFHKQTTGIVTL